MRITAGRFRGRALEAPRGMATRPTGARARTALFDTLAPRLEGARVADLFAGTGALGLEALSRGAAHVDFYESARPALDALRRNIATLGVADATTVVTGALPGAIRPGAPYDLILVDPPWRQGHERAVAERLVLTGRLGPESRLVIEADRRDPLDEAAWRGFGLVLVDRRSYGDTEMRFFALGGHGGDNGPTD
ncbi:MAG: 16S rRNA (guanine(966)-N(2))-methyltransferase RsmD [Deltaproteobacteria bacterium]|nr:16S rRNA (guanine(966)-N(2))-methyltransferase RsmD [Deltaproteobacteria bacterium]